MFNVILRACSITLFIGRYIYWKIEEKKAEKVLPKTKRLLSFNEFLSKYVYFFIQIVIVIQLFGLHIYQIQGNTLHFQIIGFILLVIAVGVGGLARRELGVNWVSGEEHQIKKNQVLITTGIYSYIRHPIYTAFTLSFIGGEMAAGSWLFIAFFAYFISSYVQGKREEKNLLAHFGKEYQDYMSRTKMLIPFVL